MGDRIFVAGDVHLGADNADGEAFDDFLDWVGRERREGDRLVLLGDVWDLVRRDPFGCAWETSGTITRIRRLAGEMEVHLVTGNHDAYLDGLDATRYDVAFHDSLVLDSGGTAVRFHHGNEFDRLQSDRVSEFLSGPGDRGDIDPTRGAKDRVVAGIRGIVLNAKRRLGSAQGRPDGGPEADPDGNPDGGPDATDGPDPVAYPRRERRAHAYLETAPEDKLVYGHTHAPYVRPDNGVANPGSWKTTAPVHNTYLVVEDGTITLHRHRSSGDPEELDAVAAHTI